MIRFSQLRKQSPIDFFISQLEALNLSEIRFNLNFLAASNRYGLGRIREKSTSDSGKQGNSIPRYFTDGTDLERCSERIGFDLSQQPVLQGSSDRDDLRRTRMASTLDHRIQDRACFKSQT